MSSIKDEAVLLVHTILDDYPSKVTAIVLSFSVLGIIFLYAATVSHQDYWLAAIIATEIGLSRDGSLGEIFNYGLAFTASVMFFLSSVENRSKMLFFLSLLMAFVWFDDAASYHERIGGNLVERYELQAFMGLRPQDTGEVIAWLFAGLVLGLVLLVSFLGRKPGDLGVLALVSTGFGLLVFCGIFVDMVHIAVPARFKSIIALIEDGGEMLAVAFITVISIALSRNGQAYYDALDISSVSSAK